MQLRGILISLFLIICLGCGPSPTADTTDDTFIVSPSGVDGALYESIEISNDCSADDTPNPSQSLASWCLVSCEPDNPDNNEQCIQITLPCTEPDKYGKAGWYHHTCEPEVIKIPNGRPIYAFLVNGFDQNHNLNMFHFYNFARCMFRLTENLDKKAYVHFAWWNNLLAPYMEKPLHNDASVPSKVLGALDASSDYFGFSYDPNVDPFWKRVPTKAIPAEDYQFQKDAKAVLEAIRENNPDAAIILVGHSMGGDSVIRLADSMPEDFAIDLLAPIDPVGNRTCLPNSPLANPGQMAWHNTTCYGAHTFTRFRATHTDWYYEPYRISYKDNNIGYLYHRWQNEAAFPFDWECPLSDFLCPIWGSLNIPPYNYMFDWLDVVNIFRPIPADEVQLPDRYLFRVDINQVSTNVQGAIPMNGESGTDVYPDPSYFWNWGGTADGHGEIVGFRALNPDNILQSFPLALAAPEYWPSLDIERSFDEEEDRANVRNLRISLLKEWENDPEYLDTNYWAPQKPPDEYCNARDFALDGDYCTYCMVSGDLCAILFNEVNLAPVADANGPYESECEGTTTTVSLDGSGSSDPEGADLTYFWATNCPGGYFDDPTSATPELTVDTSNGCTVECIVELTVNDDFGNEDIATASVIIEDTVSPDISSVSASPEILWPPNHKMRLITVEAVAVDNCDSEPVCKIISVISNEPANGKGDGNTAPDWEITGDLKVKLRAERAGGGSGREYTITVECTDDCENSATEDTTVTVPHDQQ